MGYCIVTFFIIQNNWPFYRNHLEIPSFWHCYMGIALWLSNILALFQNIVLFSRLIYRCFIALFSTHIFDYNFETFCSCKIYFLCFKIRIYITDWLIDWLIDWSIDCVKNRIQVRKNWKLYCHSCSLILNQSLVMLSWNPLLPQVFWNTIILIFIFWNYISLPNKSKGLQDLKSWKSHFILQSLSQQKLLLCDGLMINKKK